MTKESYLGLKMCSGQNAKIKKKKIDMNSFNEYSVSEQLCTVARQPNVAKNMAAIKAPYNLL